MANYDVNDIVEVKKREHRRRRRKKFFILLVLATIIGGMYYYRGKWLPKLQGIGEKYQTIVNDGELAKGNFPIEISGGNSYQMEYSKSALYVLSDAYLYIYKEDGTLIEKRQHGYSNAVMKTNDGKALIYECGGNKFRLESLRKNIYVKNTTNTVIFARLSDNGSVAVVTSSDKYSCELSVYDVSGTFIYGRECIDRLIDVSFNSDSSGAVLSFVSADNGSVITTSEKVSFNANETQWKSQPFETFCLSTSINPDGAVVLGDTKCAYYNNKGEIGASYSYDGKLAGCDSNGQQIATILNDDDRRKYQLMIIKNSKSEPFVIPFDEELRDVHIYDGLVYVMSKTKIDTYDFEGKLRSSADISDSYTRFVRSDKYVFLLGYDKIDRIDYES